VTAKRDNPFEEPVEIEVEQAGQGAPGDEGAPEDGDGSDASMGTAENRDEPGDALARAEADLARHREAMLRMQAEMENMRKRLTRDLERSRKRALEEILRDLLQVRDSLERGLEMDADSVTVESLREGQALTLKMLDKVMQDHRLETIDPAGEIFDPELHEAMTVLPSPDHEENTVIEVLQKGFRLHDRLIRPARVVVSRKP
jgi:molecular chaperone GrpE